MNYKYLYCKDYPKLYRWAKECLTELEQLLGARDPTFVGVNRDLEGIAIAEKEYPYISFQDGPEIRINLSTGINDEDRMRWQIAHECVHIIDPVPLGQATVLEEGLATWFQGHKVPGQHATIPRYAAAEAWVKPRHEQLCVIVRKLRAQGARISNISCKQLRAEGIDTEVACNLSELFERTSRA